MAYVRFELHHPPPPPVRVLPRQPFLRAYVLSGCYLKDMINWAMNRALSTNMDRCDFLINCLCSLKSNYQGKTNARVDTRTYEHSNTDVNSAIL